MQGTTSDNWFTIVLIVSPTQVFVYQFEGIITATSTNVLLKAYSNNTGAFVTKLFVILDPISKIYKIFL